MAAPGTIVTESAYIVPLKDGRDTLELIDTQSAEVKALQSIVASKDIQIDKLISAFEDLNRNRLQERKRQISRTWITSRNPGYLFSH